MASDAHRLNRWSWIFIMGGTIRALILPLVAATFASGGVLLWRPELLALAVLAPAGLYAYLRQRILTYRFTDDDLVVRDGLLFRNVRQIPYARIHNVALIRNPLHRALGVASVRIETAGGGQPEAVLRVLSLEAVEELKRRTLEEAGRGASEDAAARAGRRLVETTDAELVRLGLISNRGFVVVAAVVGGLTQIDGVDDWISDRDWPSLFSGLRDHVPTWLGDGLASGSVAARVFVGIAAFVAAIAALRLLSIAWYLVRYRGFSLTRHDDDLLAEYGLITRVSSVIPVHRIQLVTVTASLLHRAFDRESVEVETAGASDEGSDFEKQLSAAGVKLTRQWLAPIVPGGRAAGLLRDVMPELDLDTVEWTPIESRATRRIVKRVALIVVPIAVVSMVAAILSPISVHPLHALWLPAVVLPTAWLGARRWVRNAGWAVTEHAIVFKSGWLGRHTSAVRFANVQTASVRQSPFDRRHDMATLAVDTAGASSEGHRVAIPYLDATVAAETLRRLYRESGAIEFRW